jgi:hypothetical protein
MNIPIANPKVSTEVREEFAHSPESGLVSVLYYSNPDFWTAMKQAFGIKDDLEELMGVVVTDAAIKAKIRLLNKNSKRYGVAEPVMKDLELKYAKCEQCGEPAWDGYICHSCGLKDI